MRSTGRWSSISACASPLMPPLHERLAVLQLGFFGRKCAVEDGHPWIMRRCASVIGRARRVAAFSTLAARSLSVSW